MANANRESRGARFLPVHAVMDESDSLISGSRFPDASVKIPFSLQRQIWLLLREVWRNESLTETTGELGPQNWRNSLYFSLLVGNLAGEGFASDCVLRQLVSTGEKPFTGNKSDL
jgi:hypothetical protein